MFSNPKYISDNNYIIIVRVLDLETFFGIRSIGKYLGFGSIFGI